MMGVLFAVINGGHTALSLWLVDRFAGGLPVKTDVSARAFSLILFLTAVLTDAITGLAFAGVTYFCMAGQLCPPPGRFSPAMRWASRFSCHC